MRANPCGSTPPTTGLRGSSSVIKANIVISLYYVKGAAVPLKISEELRQMGATVIQRQRPQRI